MTYQHFASFYDRLMNNVPYHLWLEYFDRRIHSTNQKVLDLGCGTGAIAIPLAQKGFQVTGLDLSEEMLTIADEKARKEQVDIHFLQQSMTDLSLLPAHIFDTIICFCDSLNYLTDEQDVIKTVKGVHHLLKPGGAFMFDVHSIEKIEKIFLDQTFVSTDDDISFIWNCFEGDEPYSIDHELSFFVYQKETGLYERFDEVHSQRTFSVDYYKQLLEQLGFINIEISSDFQEQLSTGEKERIFFSCIKK
ncbi:class I SAM-dependent DNA methyltransferase [Bacillus pinisoli]|uniref:class I SAM-dependent DNA methyltransferase n=1 Tax=Bacillus pinisoli TaxID=2901866 RepID=UPI001FF3AC8F|nr:class I SAM-dependent methyltransferase [Bacillus pinisoli]